MGRYVTQRVLKGLITLLITITITFLILRLLPADPAMMMLGDMFTEDQRVALMAKFGLDKPLWQQYVIYLGNLLRGDLGMSFFQRRPVMQIISEKLPWTLLLMISTQILTMLVGIPLGIYSGYKRGSLFDQAVNAVAIFGISIFVPWLGFTLLYFFGYKLPIFPVGGAYTVDTTGWNRILDIGLHMVLPVVTLMVIYLANYVLYTRGSIIDVMEEDYIKTARSKGMKERRVLWGHAAQNAMIPTVTMAGMMLGRMVGGAVLTETIYAYPGVGRMIYQAVGQQDYPVLQGAFIILALSVIVMNIITDIAIVYLDPRIKLEREL